MARAEEQQYMSTTIQKNVHSEVRRTAIITTIQKTIVHGVYQDDERRKRQIAMCRDDVPDKLKNKAKAATETTVRKSFNTILKKGCGGRVVKKYC